MQTPPNPPQQPQQPQYPQYPQYPQNQYSPYPQQPPYYPYPPQAPLMRQPKKSISPLLIVGIVLGILVASCCGLGALYAFLNPIHTTAGTTQPTHTPTPVDNAVFAPTLGGTTDDFLARYQPVPGSNGLSYTTTIEGQLVAISITPDDPSQSLDNQAHIVIVTVQVPNTRLGTETWSTSTADKIAQTFLPVDASFQRLATTNGVHDHIYHSDGMAQTFTADQFTNDFGDKLVPVGTISYSCKALPPDTSGYEWCNISIGSY